MKVVMLHIIKLMGLEHRAPCKHIFCPYTHPRRLGWGQKVKTFFIMKIVMCKGMEQKKKSTMQAHILSLHTP